MDLVLKSRAIKIKTIVLLMAGTISWRCPRTVAGEETIKAHCITEKETRVHRGKWHLSIIASTAISVVARQRDKYMTHKPMQVLGCAKSRDCEECCACDRAHSCGNYSLRHGAGLDWHKSRARLGTSFYGRSACSSGRIPPAHSLPGI